MIRKQKKKTAKKVAKLVTRRKSPTISTKKGRSVKKKVGPKSPRRMGPDKGTGMSSAGLKKVYDLEKKIQALQKKKSATKSAAGKAHIDDIIKEYRKIKKARIKHGLGAKKR